MKKYNLLQQIALIIFLFGGIGLTGCSKNFLNQTPQGALNPTQISNQQGVDALLIGAYAALGQQNNAAAIAGGSGPWETSPDNWIYGSVAGGDSHKGSSIGDQPPIVPIATAQENASNGFFNDKWKALYECVTRCNKVLYFIDQYGNNLPPADATEDKAEALFLRGHFYFELKKLFNNVPWITDTSVDYNIPNTANIWSNIEADFQFAWDSLPATQSQIGRANKWAAGVYLAKTYLYEGKYSDAKALFDQIVANGVTAGGAKYALDARFEDNFDAAENNSPESVFAVQMVGNDGTNTIANSNPGDMLNFPYNSPFGCCGFYQPSVDLVNSYRTDADGLPLIGTDPTAVNNPANALYNESANAVKNDMNILSTASFTPDAGNLDPRIDWTVGRRGIPFHDWGLHPGAQWIRDQTSAGPYSNKKNIYWQATAATYANRSSWAPGTAINCNIIRYADVLLMAAECEAQLGNYANAENYVNQVRARAANSVNILCTYINNSNPMGGFTTTPAANYNIARYPAGYFTAANALPLIYFERKLELACEGQRFFDLARWGIAATTLNAYYQYELKQGIADLSTGNFTAGKNEYFPIPQAQIDLSNGVLKQNPGY